MKSLQIVVLLCGCAGGCLYAGAQSAAGVAPALSSRGAVLSFPAVGGGSGYGVKIHAEGGGADVYAAQPVQVLVCGPCTNEAVEYPFSGAGYASVAAVPGGVQANATYTSPKGSIFGVVDVYSVGAGSDAAAFRVQRTVTVTKAAAGDVGFNSEYQVGFAKPVGLTQYHFFAPGIWYDKNANSAQGGGFGTNTLNSYFYWRETRSALPLMMIQDPTTGSTLTLAHVDPMPAPGMANLNTGWQVDPTVQYGSIGVQQVPQVALGFMFPGSEGDGSYLTTNLKSYLANGASTNWVRRSHPVTTGFSQTYTLMLSLGRFRQEGSADFRQAMAHTWREYYDVFHPKVTEEPADVVYQDGINLVNGYVETVNGATGLPFGRPVTSALTPAVNPVYEMGYVGQQIPLAFEMFRYGVLHGDATSKANGEQILNFWAIKAQQSSGLPYALYDATTETWQSLGGSCPYPIFTRLVTDGMEGMVQAAVFARQHNMPQPQWESFAQGFGDWLVSHQNADHSFYRAYSPDGMPYSGTCLSQNPYSTSEANSMDPVRFLVQLYFATGQQKYLTAAQQAGQYALGAIFKPVQYVGGTIDNPNVIDKEGGVEAMHGALALLDAAIATGDAAGQKTWLHAAQEAANYTATWQYAWTFPIGLPAGTASFGAYPAYEYSGTRALGVIATGQSSADISLSYESYDFFRLALFQLAMRGDGAEERAVFDAKTANQLWNNTKLTTQLTGVAAQQFGYVNDGMLGEGVDLSEMLYGSGCSTVPPGTLPCSSEVWLPWLTNAELDPLERVMETFHAGSLSEAGRQGLETLLKENEQAYPSPGSIGWGK